MIGQIATNQMSTLTNPSLSVPRLSEGPRTVTVYTAIISYREEPIVKVKLSLDTPDPVEYQKLMGYVYNHLNNHAMARGYDKVTFRSEINPTTLRALAEWFGINLTFETHQITKLARSCRLDGHIEDVNRNK